MASYGRLVPVGRDQLLRRRVILLAGASGSGKSRVARLSGCPRLALDDFYFDSDHPVLPHTLGIVDWDHIASWDAAAAVAAIKALCETGTAEVPHYDIALNARTGTRHLDLGRAPMFVAEGVFAPDIAAACRAAGLCVDALYLDRPRTVTLLLRLVRDLSGAPQTAVGASAPQSGPLGSRA